MCLVSVLRSECAIQPMLPRLRREEPSPAAVTVPPAGWRERLNGSVTDGLGGVKHADGVGSSSSRLSHHARCTLGSARASSARE